MTDVAALVDGTPATALPATDRGLHYGDGVFRTVRIAGGGAQAWPWHLERLAHDCRRLQLAVPEAASLDADRAHLFADGGDGVLKIIVTRGSAGRGYTPPEASTARRVVLRYPLPGYPPAHARAGVTIGVSEVRLAAQPALAGVKHLNRLEQVLARRECAARGWAESLMQTAGGRVVSGTTSNLFVVRDGQLHTPAITVAGVVGATRQRLLAACTEQGRICRETELTLDDVAQADELFLCNSVMGLWPIQAVDQHQFTPGSVTRWCQTCLAG